MKLKLLVSVVAIGMVSGCALIKGSGNNTLIPKKPNGNKTEINAPESESSQINTQPSPSQSAATEAGKMISPITH